MINSKRPIPIQSIRRIGWIICLVLVVGLAFGSLRPEIEAIRQAMGVRGLLQAGAEISSDDNNNPFICLRKVGNSAEAQSSLVNIKDDYLRGVGLCIAGEDKSGLEEFIKAGDHSNADVQYSAGISTDDAQTRVDRIVKLGLGNNELVGVMKNLGTQPGIDPYPALRILAQKANAKSETWYLWLQGSSRLETNKDWQAALEWINEGLGIGPPEVQSSLYMRAGQIYATASESRDYHTALEYYDQAIEMGDWIYPDDELFAHLYRGDIYRILTKEYGSDLALVEFNTALKLQPGNYWAYMNIGNTYLFDLKDTDLAESYYRQALADNKEYPYAYFYLGEVYQTRGDNATAAYWYRQALERQPDWQAAIDFVNAQEENK